MPSIQLQKLIFMRAKIIKNKKRKENQNDQGRSQKQNR